jgi:hypothetical protein
VASSPDYHFITVWNLNATCAEVRDILNDATTLPQWWPSVYLTVKELDPGTPDGTGRTFDLFTKGWLPYTLRWKFIVTEPMTETGGALDAEGDFVGRGRWTFEQRGDTVRATYDWRIRAEKPLLRRLTWLMRPIFAANHRWAMARGEESIKLEIRRRRARTDHERDGVPAAPQASFRRFVRSA